jgi:hypothetical protein
MLIAITTFTLRSAFKKVMESGIKKKEEKGVQALQTYKSTLESANLKSAE